MMSRSSWVLSLLLTVASAGIAFWGVAQLPTDGTQIPVHFNLAGQPDRYGSWAEATALMTVFPVSMLVTLALVGWVVPRIERRPEALTRSSRSLGTVIVATLAFLVGIQVTVVRAMTGPVEDILPIVTALVGVLYLVTGNVLGKIQPNSTFGIRTPWTLADDRVWLETHRFGGWTFVAAGAVLLAAAASLPSGPWLLGVMVAVSVLPTLVVVVASALYARGAGA
jgi:uncharacterized membrane protein